MATGGADSLVSLYDYETLACTRSYYECQHAIKAMSFSADSRFLAYADELHPRIYIEAVDTGCTRVQGAGLER